MFGNYLKVAIRNLLKFKMFSLLNISGLAIGMTCCVLVFYMYRTKSDTTYSTKKAIEFTGY